MSAPEKGNTYLEKVVAEQAVLEDDLRARRAPAAPAAMAAPGGPVPQPAPLAESNRALGGAPAADRPAPDRWTCGSAGSGDGRMSSSRRTRSSCNAARRARVAFRFNPSTDSFLVVPGATQTILINAYCICRELPWPA